MATMLVGAASLSLQQISLSVGPAAASSIGTAKAACTTWRRAVHCRFTCGTFQSLGRL